MNVKTIKLRQAAHRSSIPLAASFRIEVFHEGESLLATVMDIDYLEQLLDVTGHLKVRSLQKWLTIILEADEAPEFTLSERRDVIFTVTATGDPVTQGSARIH